MSLESHYPWTYIPDPVTKFSTTIPDDRIIPTIADPNISVWSVYYPPNPDTPTIAHISHPASLFPRSSPLPSIKNMTPLQRRIVSHGLALCVLVSDYTQWPLFQGLAHNEDHLHSLRSKFFKIFASFALHIYDPEDFLRLVEVSMIKNNALELCKDIEAEYGADNLVELVSTGKIKIEKYPFLWQQDVDFILRSYQEKSQSSHDSMEDNSDCFQDSVVKQVAAYYDDIINGFKCVHLHDHYLTTAYEAIEDHDPLKEEQKLDLMLNATKPRHVLRQALYLEAWRGFKEEDLESLCLEYSGPNHDEMLIFSFHRALSQLAFGKAILINLSEVEFRYLTETRTMRNFNYEVLKAVRVANFERMRLGYRFLTTKHLLYGLSKSRVGDKMEVFEKTWIPTREDRDFGEINLLYIILKLSCDVASRLGHEEVLLEHLYLATMFGTRLMPTKKKKISDGSEELIDWNSVFEQGAIKDFLKESVVEPEKQQLRGKIMSVEALWGHYFGADCAIPLTPRGLLRTLAREFRENKFKPLEEGCVSTLLTQNPDIGTAADDALDYDEDYCHLYSQFISTLYEEDM